MNYFVSNTSVNSRSDNILLPVLFWYEIVTPSMFLRKVNQPFGHLSNKMKWFSSLRTLSLGKDTGITSYFRTFLCPSLLSVLSHVNKRATSLNFPLFIKTSFRRIFEHFTLTALFLSVNLNSIAFSLNTKIQKTSHDNN